MGSPRSPERRPLKFAVAPCRYREIDRDYYVRLGSDEGSDPAAWPDDAPDGSPPRRQYRRPFPWGRTILGILVAAALAWASFSPGGLKEHLTGVSSSLSGTIADLTQSGELEKASKMFDTWYDQQGAYPNETQSQLDQQPGAAWGEGMDVTWCSSRDVVLTALTASGTVSRLLADGKVVGDVSGQAGCPADLGSPLPWKPGKI